MNASCMEILQSPNNNDGCQMNNGLLPVVVGDLLHKFMTLRNAFSCDYVNYYP
jgi:hypothetical protein